MVLKKKTLEIYKYENTPFHAFSLENGLNKFHFGTIQSMATTYET